MFPLALSEETSVREIKDREISKQIQKGCKMSNHFLKSKINFKYRKTTTNLLVLVHKN
jgi:hypothetical protein